MTKLKDKQYPGTNAGPRTVGTKQANAGGLVDMLGSVWEWCRDSAGTLPGRRCPDISGQDSDPRRAERSGSWRSYAAECRAASRFLDLPGVHNDNRGFRITLVTESYRQIEPSF